jgi:mono/diheme cytochrome c family protein
LLLLSVAVTLAAACGDRVFRESQRLGGVEVDADTLERGRTLYRRYCVLCHGEEGDGRGVSAQSLWPRPRDFRTARFKYAGVENRGLPHDDELARIVRGGLAGTAMQPWDLTEAELLPILAYIKTFSPPGRGFRNQRLEVKKPSIPPDPFAGGGSSAAMVAAAIERGERLYHSYFECAKCHPSYVEPARFREWGASQRVGAAYAPAPKWAPEYDAVLLPPDFLRHPLRSVRRDPNGGARGDDLYRVIAYGLQGPMPGYGHLGSQDVWAVVQYVKSLADARLRGQTAEVAQKMRNWAAAKEGQHM